GPVRTLAGGEIAFSFVPFVSFPGLSFQRPASRKERKRSASHDSTPALPGNLDRPPRPPDAPEQPMEVPKMTASRRTTHPDPSGGLLQHQVAKLNYQSSCVGRPSVRSVESRGKVEEDLRAERLPTPPPAQAEPPRGSLVLREAEIPDRAVPDETSD